MLTLILLLLGAWGLLRLTVGVGYHATRLVFGAIAAIVVIVIIMGLIRILFLPLLIVGLVMIGLRECRR